MRRGGTVVCEEVGELADGPVLLVRGAGGPAIETWARRVADLGADPRVRYVLPFENEGEAIGVTLHHPHGQIFAYPDVPPRPARELAASEVVAGEHFVAGGPPWAFLTDVAPEVAAQRLRAACADVAVPA